MQTHDNLTIATALAIQNYHVIAITPNQKHPSIPDLQGKQGWQTATTDPHQIEQWWTKHPNANIAWSPARSNHIVIDIDGPQGAQHLKTIYPNIWDPKKPPRLLKTPRPDSGWHLIFKLPPNTPTIGKGKLHPQLEYFSNKQYTLLPPSQTKQGKYSWHNRYHPTQIPDNILQDILQHQTPQTPQPTTPAQQSTQDPQCLYCHPAAQQLLNEIANAPQGTRNDTYYQRVLRLHELACINQPQYIQQAQNILQQRGVPAREIETTTRSATKTYHQKHGPNLGMGGCQANYKQPTQWEGYPTNPSQPPKTNPDGTPQWMVRIIGDIQEQEQKWLIQDWIPADTTTLLFGDSDKGKSTYILKTAAHLSNNKNLHTIYCTGDAENPETIIKPRWLAAKGHPYGLSVLEDRTIDQHGNPVTPTTLHSLQHIEQLIENTEQQLNQRKAPIRKVGMVVLDPIENFMPPEINTHNNHQVKQALEPLSRIAQRNNLAILIIQHSNKNEGATAKNRASGSGAFMSYVRSCIVFGIDPENHNHRAAKVIKGNLIEGTNKPCKTYRFTQHNWETPPDQNGYTTTHTAATLEYVTDKPHLTGGEILAVDPEKPTKPLETEEIAAIIMEKLEQHQLIKADTLKNELAARPTISHNKLRQALTICREQKDGIRMERHPKNKGPYYYYLKTLTPTQIADLQANQGTDKQTDTRPDISPDISPDKQPLYPRP